MAGFVITKMLKPTLTYKEQINLLRSRGLVINDENYAISYLAKNSYYHLNIYFKAYQKKTGVVDGTGRELLTFLDGTTFKHIVYAHETDKLLRSFLLSALLPVELKLRTVISYHVAKHKKSDCFYMINDRNLYYFEEPIKKLHSRFNETVSANPNHPIVTHHNLKYGGQYPLFVIFELTSFNFLVDYFSALSKPFQNQISYSYFGVNNPHDLRNWMECLCDLRNTCAHQNFLFRRDFYTAPIIKDRSVLYDPSSRLTTLYNYAIPLAYLSDKDDFESLLDGIVTTQQRFNLINTRNYGFGIDWKDRLESVPHLFRYPF